MGTPEFAVAGLQLLVESDFTIVGVITAPDRRAGRGRKLQQSKVKTYALGQGIKTLQPTNLKDEQFLAELQELQANLYIVVAFRMLPKVVWQMPEFGTFNLHASLLPQYRGAAPINWAIINGETETGVTTFFIDEKIDTGEIILQQKTNIEPNENAGHLHDRLMKLGAELILKTVGLIETNTVELTTQVHNDELSAAPKLFKETCRVDWTKNIPDIHNHIRGLSPYPTAWTTLMDNEEKISLKIYKSDFEYEKHNLTTGTVQISNHNIKIAVTQGYIVLAEIQLPGKRRMDAKDVLNGHTFSANAHVY